MNFLGGGEEEEDFGKHLKDALHTAKRQECERRAAAACREKECVFVAPAVRGGSR